MKKVNLVCANCGSNIFKAEMLSELGVSGIAVESKAQSSDSGMGAGIGVGVAIGKVTKDSSSEDKIEAMRKAGLNVGNFFSMKGADGSDLLVKQTDGQFVIVLDDDPVLRGIYDDGTIANNDLYRRWVAGQMAHALIYKGYRWRNSPAGFTGWLKDKGYEYQFKMLIQEYHAQWCMINKFHGETPDYENFRMRSLMFPCELAVDLIEHDIKVTRKWVGSLSTKRCRGRKYVTVPGYGHIFCDELETKLFSKLKAVADGLRSSLEGNQNGVATSLNALKKYDNLRVIRHNKNWCPEFIDCYKKSGAYYTMKNFILFHGCEFEGLKGEDAVERLNEHVIGEYDGWVLLGMLKKMLQENGIDLKAKIAEWAEAKKQRLANRK